MIISHLFIFLDLKKEFRKWRLVDDRWSVFLSGYDYEIKHIPGTQICHADCLSRSNLDSIKVVVLALK